MIRIVLLFLTIIILAGCGSDDGSLIIVSSFPAQGQNPNQGTSSGASVLYFNGNSKNSGKVDMVFDDGSSKTCDGSSISESAFLVSKDCLE